MLNRIPSEEFMLEKWDVSPLSVNLSGALVWTWWSGSRC